MSLLEENFIKNVIFKEYILIEILMFFKEMIFLVEVLEFFVIFMLFSDDFFMKLMVVFDF